MIKPTISQTFSVLAAKEPISVDHIDSWYLREASGSAPSITDSRWEFHNEGDPIPPPTPSLPYLWKKSVTYFTDGTKSDTVVEFCGGLGKNGIDYDLVPSHSSIVKSEDGALSPSNVSCAIIKRNADGSAEQLTAAPTGYSIEVRRNDSVVNSNYTPGGNISTSGTTSGITFILKYGTIVIERHNLNVIAEGAQGLTGRGIQSQDYRFKALSSASMPETPNNNSTWETWSALSQSGYSSSYPYLYRCIRTVYIDGIGNTSVEYVVDGPTVWGQTGNGIASVSYSRKYTMVFAAPSATDGGWIESSSSDYPTEAGLSKENRYLWERKRTIYTQSSSTYEVSLLAQFDSGLCENLLENTAFNDINDMDAWQIRNGSVVERALDNTNGFKKSPDTAAITDFLQQRIYRSGVITKLQPSTWYTLSFYAYASLIYPIYNLSTPAYNSSSPYYGIGSQSSIYMESGQTITVSVTGYVASAAVKVRYYAWRQNSDGSWAQSRNAEFTSTSATTKTFTFTNTSGSAAQIYFRGYVYLATGSQNSSSATQNRGYISNVVIYRGAKLDTYLYRSDNGDAIVHDSAHPWIVNGVSVSSEKQMDDAFNTFPQMTGSYVYFSGDGHVRWQMTTGWKRYSVTFFTSSSLVDDVEYRILFRLQGTGHETVITKPKLERNTIATEWIEHTNDRMAADFQHIYAGEWASGTAYMYANGVRHVVRAPKSDGTKTFFRLKKRTPASGRVSSTSPYAETSWWEEASFLRFAAAELLLADQAIITFTQTNRILVKNSAGNVSAGMGGAIGDGDVPLWVGASYDDRLSAPFRVNIQGHIFGTKGMIGGWVLADTKMYSQLGRINGTESPDYTNSSFVPNISLDSVNGEILAGKDVRINGDGIQLFNGNTLCAKLSNEFINTAIDTTPQTGNGTLSTYYSNSVYIPTTAYYRATATWQVTKDCGYCYNGSTIKLTNATFKITLPAAPSGGTLSWGTSTLKVYVKGSNGGSYVFYTTTVTTSTINQALTFSNTVTIDGSSLKEGRYTIYYEIVSNFTSQFASGSTPSATLYISAAGWSYSRSVALITLIGNNGIFTRNSNTTYMIQTSDGFLARCGNYALRVTSSGIQKSVNGGTNWTSL